MLRDGIETEARRAASRPTSTSGQHSRCEEFGDGAGSAPLGKWSLVATVLVGTRGMPSTVRGYNCPESGVIPKGQAAQRAHIDTNDWNSRSCGYEHEQSAAPANKAANADLPAAIIVGSAQSRLTAAAFREIDTRPTTSVECWRSEATNRILARAN